VAAAAEKVVEREVQQGPKLKVLAAHSATVHSPSVFYPPVLGSYSSPEGGSERRANPFPTTLDWVVTAV